MLLPSENNLLVVSEVEISAELEEVEVGSRRLPHPPQTQIDLDRSDYLSDSKAALD